MSFPTPTELRAAVATAEARLGGIHDRIDSGDQDDLDQLDDAAGRAAHLGRHLTLPLPDDLDLLAVLGADGGLAEAWIRGDVGERRIAHRVAPGTASWWLAEQAVAAILGSA